MNVKAHVLRNIRFTNWKSEVEGRWHYRDLAADPTWRDGWISFDTLTYSPIDRQVYCGLNSIDGDLLYRFDPKSQKFTSLNTQRWADKFDSKIHRTLLQNPLDGCFYFPTSLLHDVDQQREAVGGKLVRYDPKTDEYTVLGIPAPMLYIQSIAADFKRGLIFGFTYPAESFFQFDLKTGKSETLAYTGNSLFFSQPHNPVIDADGWVWGTYAETRAWDEMLSRCPIRLFKYHPDGKRFVWFDFGLSRKSDPDQLLKDPPKPAGVELLLETTRHRDDHGFCDSMVFDGERYIYAGTVAGVLCRIDTKTDRVEKLAHVMATGRFPALCLKDGVLYGAGGLCSHTQLVRWKIGTDHIEGYFDLVDPAINDRPARIHEMAIDDEGTLYLAENDNHERSSYLWTVRID